MLRGNKTGGSLQQLQDIPIVVSHVVLFRPRRNLSADERGALVASFSRAVREIPSIRHSRVGRRIMHGRGYEESMREDYQYIAVLEFDDLAGLKAYLEHPAHEELAGRFSGAFDAALMYDYEITDRDAGLAEIL
jgi:hypothetical protein